LNLRNSHPRIDFFFDVKKRQNYKQGKGLSPAPHHFMVRGTPFDTNGMLAEKVFDLVKMLIKKKSLPLYSILCKLMYIQCNVAIFIAYF